jgi:hypothetical protein
MSLTHKPLLLLRPPQGDEESFPGYITRLCVANRLAGAASLAKLFGLSFGALMMMDPHVFRQIVRGELALGDIPSEQYGRLLAVAKKLRGASYTKICPRCFKEERFHSRRWDWETSVACEIHGVRLLGNCPQCGERISHLRRHLYICRCGMDWRCCVTPHAPIFPSLF